MAAELLHANGRTDKHGEAHSRFEQILRTRLKKEEEMGSK